MDVTKRLACNCYFGEEYPSIPLGKTIIGCKEDNIWCNNWYAGKCESYIDKNNVVNTVYYYCVNTFKNDEPVQLDGYIDAENEEDVTQKLIENKTIDSCGYEFLELEAV